MGKNPKKLIDSARSRNILARVSAFVGKVTFRINRGTPAETIEEIARQRGLNDGQRQFLNELGGTKAGAAFIDEQVQDMNRGAFHRSAFVLNAFTQLGFVDLAAQLSMSVPQLKLALVVANLILAWIAHRSIRQSFRALLAGPNTLPPKRRLWGLLSNPKYNKAVKMSSRPHARSARKEKSLYRPAYFFNALSIFFGSQFIIPPAKLIFPLGFIVGKLSGFFSTLVMVFDLWRGVKAGDDALRSSEREVSVYRDFDI
jgi:hypothetical protein